MMCNGRKKTLAWLFVVCMVSSLFMSSFVTYAEDGIYNEEEAEYVLDDHVCTDHENHVLEDQTRAIMETCATCGFELDEVCMRSHSVFSAYDYHSYSGGTCTVSTYTGRIYMYCTNCMYSNSYRDGHWCYSVHQNCGKGITNICQFYVPGLM